MEIFEPAFEYVSPEIGADTYMGRLALNHYNSRLRLFDEPNSHFDHLEHEFTDDRGVTRVVGISLSEEQMQRFLSLGYPRVTLPYVDSGTLQWAIDNGMKHIWHETDEIGISHEEPDGNDAA